MLQLNHLTTSMYDANMVETTRVLSKMYSPTCSFGLNFLPFPARPGSRRLFTAYVGVVKWLIKEIFKLG